MKRRIGIFLVSIAVVASAFLTGGMRAQQPVESQDHEQHHPAASATPKAAADEHAQMMSMMAAMKAADQKLDVLVKKMRAAKGAEKTDAMAELLTTLVQDRHAMHDAMMSHMSMMMNMGDRMGQRGQSQEAPEK